VGDHGGTLRYQQIRQLFARDVQGERYPLIRTLASMAQSSTRRSADKNLLGLKLPVDAVGLQDGCDAAWIQPAICQAHNDTKSYGMFLDLRTTFAFSDWHIFTHRPAELIPFQLFRFETLDITCQCIIRPSFPFHRCTHSRQTGHKMCRPSLWLLIGAFTSLGSSVCPIMDGNSNPATLHARQGQSAPPGGNAEFLEQFSVDDTGAFLTSDAGGPIEDQASLRAGARGPTLLEDFILRQKIMHFDHERVSGAGASEAVAHCI
jgi:hypothetical protein